MAAPAGRGAPKTGPWAGANFFRKPGRGLLLACAYPFLKAIAILSRGRPPKDLPKTLLVFQAYQVGDLYMALPALHLLSSRLPIVVACRPGCEGLLRRAGLDALPFPHPFFHGSSPKAFRDGLRAARALRGRIGEALDLNADPRTALMLKAAGAARCVSYRRPYGWFFDETFPIPSGARHQAEKDRAVAAGYLALRRIPPPRQSAAGAGTMQVTGNAPVAGSAVPGGAPAAGVGESLLLSCWTRKDEKNWPLEHWDRLLERLLSAGRRIRILDAPDGDAAFRGFRERWRGRVPFLSAGLEDVEEAVRESAGVVATDNFLGHMAAYHGKPVLWINGSSDPGHVAPRGPGTRVVQVEPMPCRPCGHKCVNLRYKCCLTDLGVEQVLAGLEAWLPAA